MPPKDVIRTRSPLFLDSLQTALMAEKERVYTEHKQSLFQILRLAFENGDIADLGSLTVKQLQTLVAFGQGRVLDVIDYETRRKTESARAILDPLCKKHCKNFVSRNFIASISKCLELIRPILEK